MTDFLLEIGNLQLRKFLLAVDRRCTCELCKIAGGINDWLIIIAPATVDVDRQLVSPERFNFLSRTDMCFRIDIASIRM